MAEMTEAMRLKIELSTWKMQEQMAAKQVEQIEAKLRAFEIPQEPPHGAMFLVDVKFRTSPNEYRFLVKHVRLKGYYTTGVLRQNAHFETWEELYRYFSSEEVEYRSAFTRLVVGREVTWGTALDRRENPGGWGFDGGA